MAARMIVDRRNDLEAMPLIEGRRLKRERHQHDLGAAAPFRLLLGCLQQLCAESTVPLRLLHPELTHLTGATPRVPTDARYDAIAVSDEEGEERAVDDVGRARVELVDPIFQVLHFVRRRVDQSKGDVIHRLTIPPTCAGSSMVRRRTMLRTVNLESVNGPGQDVVGSATTSGACVSHQSRARSCVHGASQRMSASRDSTSNADEGRFTGFFSRQAINSSSRSLGIGRLQIVEGKTGGVCTWCINICPGVFAWNSGCPVSAQ